MRNPGRLGRRGRMLLGVAVGGALFGIATAVQASIPDGAGAIHGCYDNRSGAVRVIDTGASQACDARRETALNWNQRGPTGPIGGPGAPGLRGPTGPTGDFGTGYFSDASHIAHITTQYPTLTDVASILLPAGKWRLTTRANVLLGDGTEGSNTVHALALCTTVVDVAEVGTPAVIFSPRVFEYRTGFTLEDFVTSDGTSRVTLRCAQENDGANASTPTNVTVLFAIFTAVPVGDYRRAPSS